ncbi:hypothetical protein DPEC_G00360360 [Dallia pectoralis]|uniref:Uncharacterized protein n=1 Tax=Dallia pectoralis TaxID=75939 RepID=A0ACC2F0X6_DALPE|nr:hypothetical protein DPEC_G00360360 [Dallia pectoralis]
MLGFFTSGFSQLPPRKNLPRLTISVPPDAKKRIAGTVATETRRCEWQCGPQAHSRPLSLTSSLPQTQARLAPEGSSSQQGPFTGLAHRTLPFIHTACLFDGPGLGTRSQIQSLESDLLSAEISSSVVQRDIVKPHPGE